VPGTGGLQIRSVDQGQRRIFAGTLGQQWLQQLLVDRPQSADSSALPKLVQRPHVGHFLAIGQVGKAAPRSLLAQQPQQVVESVNGCQDAQQMDAIQLCGTELLPPPPTAVPRHRIVDESVGNVRRKERQIPGGARRGQFRIHAPMGYPKQTVASTVFGTPSFLGHKNLHTNRLRRIP